MALVVIGGWAFRAESLRGLLPPDFGGCIVFVDPYPPEKAQQTLMNLSGGKQPLIVIGWSLGAMLALEYAAQQPEKVARLVLLNPTARFCSSPGYRWGQPTSALRALKRALKRDRPAALTGFYQLCFAPERLPQAKLDKHLQEMDLVSDVDLLSGLNYLERSDLRESLVSVRAQAVLIHGGEDAVIPQEASAALAATLSGRICARIVVEGVGHALPVTRTSMLRTIIQTFLA